VERSGRRGRLLVEGRVCVQPGEAGGPTWWCRDKSDASLRRKIDKVRSLWQFGCVALGREYHPDGVSRPAEANACAALSGRVRGDAVDVWDVAAVRHAELYQGVRNLAR